MESEANAVASRLAEGGSIRDPDISAWIIDNIAPLLGTEGVGIDSTDHGRIDHIVEAFRQAADEEITCGRRHFGSALRCRSSGQVVSLLW
jgi:hypothetical protein